VHFFGCGAVGRAGWQSGFFLMGNPRIALHLLDVTSMALG